VLALRRQARQPLLHEILDRRVADDGGAGRPFQPLASSTTKSFSAPSMSAAPVAVVTVTGAMSSSRRR
jgi:hypothetical protein